MIGAGAIAIFTTWSVVLPVWVRCPVLLNANKASLPAGHSCGVLGVREEVRRHGNGPHAWRRVERSHGPGGPPGAKIRRPATRHNVARVLATGQGSKVGFVAGRERERKSIVLLATPDGWRHSVLTLDGGMFCGRLAEVPVDAGPAEARAAAAAMVVALARDVHGVRVDVTWDPSREPGSWTGQVTVAAPPPKAGG